MTNRKEVFILIIAVLSPFSPTLGIELCVGGYFPKIVSFVQPLLILTFGLIPAFFIFVMPWVGFVLSVYLAVFSNSQLKYVALIFLFINLVVGVTTMYGLV